MKYLKITTNFAITISQLSDVETGRLFKAMMEYTKSGEAPNLTGNEKFVWPTAKEIIDKQRKSSDAHIEALKIANAKKQNATANFDFATANCNFADANDQKEREREKERRESTPTEKERTKEKDIPLKENKEIEKGKENPPPRVPPAGSESPESLFGYNEFLLEAVKDWLAYKKERRENYKPTGLRNLFTQIQNNVTKYGEQAVIDLIVESMSQNYQGITWDKLRQRAAKSEQKKKLSFHDLYEESVAYDQNRNDQNFNPFAI